MSVPTISVQGLSKAYRIGLKEEVPDTLVGAVTSLAKNPLRGFQRLRRLDAFSETDESDDVVWALRDVSFEVQEGEVVGIIGRNGAGKSTLLKVLSRITEPTRGRAVIRGRVSSLLEVGTGFHPELTGRENVYMNGTILGMTKREIDRKFDEIVDFSGVEKFLDTPIKRYSSGMQVRLAFAVAAHLEPEILIVDEVLAVGDAEFQKKCLGKMQDVATSGRTVLFVSHNMSAVQHLCRCSVVMREGKVAFLGPTPAAISEYLASRTQSHGGRISLAPHPSRRKGCYPLLTSVRFLDADGNESDRFETGMPLTLQFTVNPLTPLRSPHFGIGVDSETGGRVFSLATYLSSSNLPEIASASQVTCTIKELPLIPGRYYLSLSAGTQSDKLVDALDEAVHIDVVPSDYFGNGATPPPGLGPVAVQSQWKAAPLAQQGECR